MMKRSLRKLPLVGKACESAKHIFVDNSSPSKTAKTISNARETLKDGTSLVVFPEGRRTETGKMGPFKKGAFQLAEELQLPIVPMTIDGSWEVLPRTKGFNFVSWHPLILTIHKPILPTCKGQEDVKNIMQQSREAINSALPTALKD
jgi:1-acyl-sn-glycerol-3-phosphate acyltransferase